MALFRPIVDSNGNLSELADGNCIRPNLLGSGTPTSSTVLLGDGSWTDIGNINYWIKIAGNHLYYNAGRVIIGGTASNGAAYNLDVTGNSYFTGNSYVLGSIGIGTITPSQKLHVKGSILVENDDPTSTWIGLKNESAGTGTTWKMVAGITGSSYEGLSIYDSTAAATRFVINTTGSILINNITEFVTNAVAKLQVNGGILQKNIISRMVYADSNGTLVEATAANIAATLGADNYIQNQYAGGQAANAWISGYMQAAYFTTTGAFASSNSIPLVFANNGAQDIWSQGVSGIVRIVDAGYANINFSVNQNGNGYFRGNVGIGATTPPTKLYVQTSEPNTNTSTPAISLSHRPDVYASINPFKGNYSHELGISFSTDYGNGPVEMLTIVPYGNIGIGINTPTPIYGRTVHIQNPGGASLYLNNGTVSGFLAVATSLSAFMITSSSAHPITFGVNYVEKVRITTNGRLLVGITSEIGGNTHKLQVDSGSTTGEGIYVKGNIRATGNIVADGYFSGTQSDRFYKSKFKEVRVIDVIDNIKVQSYNHSAYNGARLIGSVAQDIEKYFPELITKDGNNRLRVDNYGYSALALQLGKEVKSEVDILKERVKELEKQVERLTR